MTVESMDDAVARCAQQMTELPYAHLLGIGVQVGERVWIAGPAVDRPTNLFSVTKAVVARGVFESMKAGIFSDLDDVVSVRGSGKSPPKLRDLLWMTQAWHRDPDMDDIERNQTDPHTYNHHRGHTALGGQSPADLVPNLCGQNT